MTVSFIVSAFNRPGNLAQCLLSLDLQDWQGEREVIVTDNAGDIRNQRIAEHHGAHYLTFAGCGLGCYEAANLATEYAYGEYLCFPSDDDWYTPGFLSGMLAKRPADLIICDCLYNGHGWNWDHFVARPRRQEIDKGGFLVKRSVFLEVGGFPGPFDGPTESDGLLVEAVVASGATTDKASGILWSHA